MITPSTSRAEPRASLRDAIDAKCRDCAAAAAGAHWRVYVAACAVTDCPLWRVRPLPKPTPAFLTSRDAADLPCGWKEMSTEAATAAIRAANAPDTGAPGEEPAVAGHMVPPEPVQAHTAASRGGFA